jgi:hypothetical protein
VLQVGGLARARILRFDASHRLERFLQVKLVGGGIDFLGGRLDVD